LKTFVTCDNPKTFVTCDNPKTFVTCDNPKTFVTCDNPKTNTNFISICKQNEGPDKGKDKGKVYPRTGHEGTEREYRYSSTLSLTSALDEGGWSASRPDSFAPRKDPVPTV
jgi:hypothetical protein